MREKINLAILGDSISAGHNVPRRKSYAYLLSQSPFIDHLQNVSLSGTTLGKSGRFFQRPFSFYKRVWQIHRDSDLVFVLGGTNDYGSAPKQGVPLGKIGDETPATFYGAVAYLYAQLRQRCPHALIVFATPLQRDNLRWGYPHDPFQNADGHTLEDYRDAILEIGKEKGFEVIDLFSEPAFRFGSPDFQANMGDGLHPNAKGHALLAAILADQLQKSLQNRPGLV
jgi:lysophospholipase L1-like esterase